MRWVAAALVLLVAAGVVGVQMPEERQRLLAIGPTEDLPPVLKKALDPAQGFEPLPAPGPQDWLAAHPEPGQSFIQFAQSRPNRPDKKRKVLYLQPLSEFRPGEAPSVDLLREYAAAYFTLEVRVLPPLGLAEHHVSS
jgi:hypothetical protein